MANEQNLKPYKPGRSREEAQKAGRKGGIASGEARRRKKTMREILEKLLDDDYTTKDGTVMTGNELINLKLFEQASKGNVKAYETIRSTIGQDPVQKIQVAEVEPDVIAEVERMVNENE